MISPLASKVNGPHEEWAETRCRSASGEKSPLTLIVPRPGGFECYRLLATVMDSVPMCSVRFGILRPDPHRVFAGIQPLAFVCNELFLDVGVCILRSACSLGICRELGNCNIHTRQAPEYYSLV
jgi:hypothetical protein